MAATPPLDDLEDVLTSFELYLRSENKSRATITNYLRSARLFDEYLATLDPRPHVIEATREHVAAFIVDQLDRNSSSTAATRFRCLQQVYRWLVFEQYIDRSPMEAMTPPAIAEKVVPVLNDDELRLLVKACEGREFEDLRDRAIVLFMVDTGARLAEVTGLTNEAIDAKAQTVVLHGKGDRERRAYFSTTTAVALDRYRRGRRSHQWGRSPAFWLGAKGPLTDSGIAQLLRRRSVAAGIGKVHPHQLRHTWAHKMKVGRMSDDEVMALGGWRSNQMLGRYGASARAERARETYERIAPGDQL